MYIEGMPYYVILDQFISDFVKAYGLRDLTHETESVPTDYGSFTHTFTLKKGGKVYWKVSYGDKDVNCLYHHVLGLLVLYGLQQQTARRDSFYLRFDEPDTVKE